MTFLHKLAQRLARMKRAPLVLLAVLACEITRRPTGPLNSGDVVRLEIFPKSLTLLPNQRTEFVVVGLTADGDTGSLPVRWTVTGGRISESGVVDDLHFGLYRSPSEQGRFKVVVRGTSPLAESADSAWVDVTPSAVASVMVSPAAALVTVGGTLQLTAIPLDSTGGPLTGRPIAWASTDPAVASVSAGGLVTGVASGTAAIVATSEGRSGTAAIGVAQVPVAFVSVTPGSASVWVGQGAQLTATPRDVGGTALPGRVVTWASSNAAVATVSGSGLVTGTAPGSVTITAMSEGQTGTAPVTVSLVPVAAVTVAPASASVTQGQTIQLTATPRDSAGGFLANRAVSWTTSNSAAATVTSSGVVTGVAAGSATITATSGGRAGTADITVTLVPVATVTVSPASATVLLGQTTPLIATPRDASGAALAGRVVTWSSGNPAVAIVSGSGVVTGLVVGSATITASSEGKNGTAGITVNAPVSSPGSVADLAVPSVTDTSVTLSFTEVTNGAGQPSSYEIRFAPGSTLSWGSASLVTRGTCASPLAGTAVGAVRTCTVLGLARATSYAFQFVAYRGTLNVDAVFGALSNVATRATTNSVAPVASITVSPASASTPVGQTVQLGATLRDAAGTTLTGRVVTWGTSNAGVAAVNATGRVTGVAPGGATVTASAEGVSGTSAITVTAAPPPPPPPPPPPAGSWPNEPTGMTLISDYGFNLPFPIGSGAAIGTTGWHINNGGLVSLISDASAILSAPGVGQWRYPQGMRDGSAPGTMYIDPGVKREAYFAFLWKPSSPFDGNPSGTNKIAFMFPNTSPGDMFIRMYGSGSSYVINVATEFPNDLRNLGNNVTSTPIVLGQWYKIEWYVKYSTSGTSRDGITRWWVNGVLQGDYRDLQMNGSAFIEFQFSPTYGGNVGATKRWDDFYWFDHVRLSGR